MDCGIALGSNLGDRVRNLRDALDRLALPVLAKSTVYETEPVGCAPDAPRFANAVVEVKFAGPPEQLLARARAVEAAMGRDHAAPRNAARIIDLDLLYCGDETRAGDELALPHPRLGARRFVLVPLAEIRPDLVLPGAQLSVADLLRKLDVPEPDPRVLAATW